MKNKIVASALTASMVIGMMASTGFADTSGAGFSDISKSYAKDAILDLQAKGILDGTNGAFNPKAVMTRAEFVVMMVKSLKLDLSNTTSSFKDVKGWTVPYIEAALKAGIITGNGNGTFAPNATLTREMSVVMLVRSLQSQGKLDGEATLNFKDANDISAWARQAIAIAVKYGLIAGSPDGKFNPKGVTNREMGATMGSNLLTSLNTIVKPEVPVTPPVVTPPVVTPPVTTPPVSSGGSSGGSGGGGGEYIPPTVTLSSIAITSTDHKISYKVNEELDITKLVVTGTYSNGTKAPIAVTNANVKGFNSKEAVASLPITVTVNGQSATYTVSIVDEVVPPVKVDKTALTTALATKLVETDYTPESWTIYSSAIGKAIIVEANVKATQVEVDNAVKSINEAELQLVKVEVDKVDKTALTTALATKLVETDYTPESWTIYSSAIGKAIIVEANEKATQVEVDNAVKSINEAELQLVKVEVDKVDKTALTTALATKLVETDYTPESWTIYSSAIGKAIIVEANVKATQVEVDNAVKSINEAELQLVKVEVDKVDKTALTTALATKLVETDYTPESWTIYSSAIGKAIIVEANEKATQVEVDETVVNIKEAKEALVFAGQSALDEAVANATALIENEDDYTEASLASTLLLLADAFELPKTTNAEVIVKTTAYNDAIKNLKLNHATVSNEEELQKALSDADIINIKLSKDIESDSAVIINRVLTLEGNDHTLTLNNIKTDKGVALGLGISSTATIKNLTVTTDSSLDDNLVEVFGNGVIATLENVAILNSEKAGLTILDGAKVVLVGDITLGGNTWGGIEVDTDEETNVDFDGVTNLIFEGVTDINGKVTPIVWIDGTPSSPEDFVTDTKNILTAPETVGTQTFWHVAVTPITVPEAPSVTAGDDKTIIGADDTMEYSTDNGVTYTRYESAKPYHFVGYNVWVRVAADATTGTPAGEVTVLVFN
ncbi:hypothetical protein PMSD_26090 [Paenibacillus macquariensis subsp. defensor]|nr:hypothetical protein PMSD_26090 [Paenibacillus macquariensis subsp. defensor]